MNWRVEKVRNEVSELTAAEWEKRLDNGITVIDVWALVIDLKKREERIAELEEALLARRSPLMGLHDDVGITFGISEGSETLPDNNKRK